MKNRTWYVLLLFLAASVFMSNEILAQGVKKVMNVGQIRWEIVDQADEGEGSWGWGQDLTFTSGYQEAFGSTKCLMIASRDFTDTTGTTHSVWVSGHGQWEVDDQKAVLPVPDSEQATIRRYYRNQPPSIVVDGLNLEDPFPLNYSDAVNPAAIPGNADGLITSFITTDMGVSIRQRVIGFAQQNHDEYIIKEYTFINTGNVDADEEIELPGQTIKDFYFLKQIRPREWNQRPWTSATGLMPGDDLRVLYGYPSREEGSDYDNLGDPDVDGGTGMLWNTYAAGEAIVFASKSPQEFNVDDINQPSSTMHLDVDFDAFTFHSNNMTTTQKQKLYEVMQNGATNLEGIFWPLLTGTKPGSHGVPLDQRGFTYITEMEGFGYSASTAWSAGPYTLAPGDSIKIAIAHVFGSISPEKAWEVGQAWINDNATFGDNVIGGPTDKLPQQYRDNPELYAADERSEQSNWAKDNWVLTGVDSLLKNARAAQWAYQNNFTVPQAPPPPSIEVTSLPDHIRITWGDEAAGFGNLAGYRVYRSIGSWFPTVLENGTTLVGGWQLIHEAGPNDREFLDDAAQTAVAHYYAVTAFDNGNGGADFDGQSHVLESNIAANATINSSERLSPGGSLDQVVVVPNPYNISSSDIQFAGEGNKIGFFNVPSTCTIRIFTESGDLVQTINHEGSGIAFWGNLAQEFQATSTGQIVNSGLYIAHIETPDGESAVRKFVIVR